MIATPPATVTTTTMAAQAQDSLGTTATGRTTYAGSAHRGTPDRLTTVAAQAGHSPADLPVLVFV